MKIVVDCFGGDNSPKAQVEGAIQALNAQKGFDLVLVGDKEKINNELETLEFDESRVEVLDAPDVITCDDKPTVAIKEKKNSSMVLAYDLLKHDEDCAALVSSGSTGALLCGSIMKIGRIKGISRPCLMPVLPTFIDGKKVLLVDAGANAECKPVNLLHFAIMGKVYSQHVLKVEKPVVGLVCNGTEQDKGNELTRQSYELIDNAMHDNFVGNIEARELFSGKYDVVVCDGFTGNAVLKSSEGAIKFVLKSLKTSIKSSFLAKIGYLFMKKLFSEVKHKLDYNEFGGALVFGIDKVVIKAHGSATSATIKAAVVQAYEVAQNKVLDKIKEHLSINGEAVND